MERGENENRRVKKTERGLGEKEGCEPVDFVLMSPIHDARFWYHDLIGQIADY